MTQTKFGKNLTWFLSELSLSETEQFETGSIEIIGENEQGQEGSTEVDVQDLALAAKNRIELLQNSLNMLVKLYEEDYDEPKKARPTWLVAALDY